MKRSYFSVFVISLISVFSNFVRAQNYIEYHKLCDQAAKQIEMGMILPAHGMLMHAFSLVPEPKAIDLFQVAKCWSQMDNYDSTQFYLQKALSLDPRIGRLTRFHNLWFEPVFGPAEWETIHASTKTFVTPTMTLKEEEILAELSSIDSTASKRRKTYGTDYERIKNDSIALHNFWRDIDTDDSLVGVQFDAFLAKNPNINFEHYNLKNKLQETINHLSLRYIRSNEPWFFEQLKIGIIDPKFYIDLFHTEQWLAAVKSNEPSTSIKFFFYDEIITDQEEDLINAYGCCSDFNINKLRYEYDWPY